MLTTSACRFWSAWDCWQVLKVYWETDQAFETQRGTQQRRRFEVTLVLLLLHAALWFAMFFNQYRWFLLVSMLYVMYGKIKGSHFSLCTVYALSLRRTRMFARFGSSSRRMRLGGRMSLGIDTVSLAHQRAPWTSHHHHPLGHRVE